MGKRRRKQNDEKEDKVNVSLDDNKGINSGNTSSCTYIEVSNVTDSANINRKKSKKHMYNDDELDKMAEVNEKDKSIEDTSRKAKKKKLKVQEQEIVNIKSQQETTIDDNQKIRKKRKSQIVVENVLVKEENSPEETQPEHITISKIGKKKQKVDKSHNDEDSQQTISTEVDNKVKKQNINNKDKKKKSIQQEVVQDEEVNNVVNNDNGSKKSKKKRKRKIIEEEPINDEDIDKYCDELEPSYNKQYEDWVKLIEANLSSNKKH